MPLQPQEWLGSNMLPLYIALPSVDNGVLRVGSPASVRKSTSQEVADTDPCRDYSRGEQAEGGRPR